VITARTRKSTIRINDMLAVDWKDKRWFTPKLARDEVDPIGTPRVLANFVRDGDDTTANSPDPMIETVRYAELLKILPDKIVNNLEKARLAREGKIQMMKAGLGFEELLSATITDGSAIASSSAEARLQPAILIPANYMQPYGNSRFITAKARGRGTTLTTNATMVFRHRIATTDVITGTAIMATGAMAADATAQTATMWEWDSGINSRTFGSAGTVFGMGRAGLAWHSAFTAANVALAFAGSAGSATPAAVTWDMTVDQYFQFTAQWSLATAYSIQCHMYRLESLN